MVDMDIVDKVDMVDMMDIVDNDMEIKYFLRMSLIPASPLSKSRTFLAQFGLKWKISTWVLFRLIMAPKPITFFFIISNLSLFFVRVIVVFCVVYSRASWLGLLCKLKLNFAT